MLDHGGQGCDRGAPIEAPAVAASQDPALVAFARGEVDAHRRVAG
jgi:hypothetical protein